MGKRWLKSIIVEDVKSMMEIINKLEVMNIKDIVIIPLSEVHKTKSVKIKNKEVIDTLSNIINTNADIQGVINFIFCGFWDPKVVIIGNICILFKEFLFNSLKLSFFV